MNQRGYPLWLLRDWTAFFAFLIAFWAFIFAGFHAGRKVARGKRLSDDELQSLFHLYANAESRLDHAIWRQAWRACGYSAKHTRIRADARAVKHAGTRRPLPRVQARDGQS